jgi:D-3-phosphoglycerate dehydrogenase
MATIFLTHDAQMLHNYYGDTALAGVRALGAVRLNTAGRPLSTAALIEAAKGCEIIVSDRQTPGEAALFDNSPELVAFLRCAVDIRTVDIEAASRNGVLVTNASPGFVDAVAELVVGMMVDLARDVTHYATAYHRGTEHVIRGGRQLAGGTLGILGYGSIGKRVAELGKALGMAVLVSDPYETVTDPELTQMDLLAVLERADFVVCLVVANPRTENLMNAAAFARMKRSAYFINVSRGNLVDEAALQEALESGQIAGAALDVGRAADQMPSPQLARLPNVIATPHIGGLTPEAIEAQALETVTQVKALVSGRLPHNAINPDQAMRLARLGIAVTGAAAS